MSARSDQISNFTEQRLYQSLKLRGINWIHMAEKALNGEPPYHALKKDKAGIQVSENLLIIAAFLAENEEIRGKAINILNNKFYGNPTRYEAILSNPSDKVDEYNCIEGFTAELLRRRLEQIEDPSIIRTMIAILEARISQLELKLPAHEAILNEQRARLNTLHQTLQSIHQPTASSSSAVEGSSTQASSLFVFDRDDTILDKEGKLINPTTLLPLLFSLGQDPQTRWAIASAGAIELGEDPAYKAILAKGYEGSIPFYAQINRGPSALINRVESITISSVIKESGKPDSEREAQDALNALLSTGKTDHETYSIKASAGPFTFEFPVGGVVTLKFGETLITLSLSSLINPIIEEAISKGDYKLFFIFDLLDQAKMRLDLQECPGLQSLGVVEIKAPGNYSLVNQKDIVFTDDKPGCVELIDQAGFTAIRADTLAALPSLQRRAGNAASSSASENIEPPTLDTYIASLYQAHERITGVAVSLDRQLAKNIRQFIHDKIIETKSFGPFIKGDKYEFRNSRGDRIKLELPSTLTIILKKLDEYDQSKEGTSALELLESINQILTLKERTKTNVLFPKRNADYKQLSELVSDYCKQLSQTIQKDESSSSYNRSQQP